MPRAHRPIPRDVLATPRYAPTISGRICYEYGLYRTRTEALKAGHTASLFVSKSQEPTIDAELVWIARKKD